LSFASQKSTAPLVITSYLLIYGLTIRLKNAESNKSMDDSTAGLSFEPLMMDKE